MLWCYSQHICAPPCLKQSPTNGDADGEITHSGVKCEEVWHPREAFRGTLKKTQVEQSWRLFSINFWHILVEEVSYFDKRDERRAKWETILLNCCDFWWFRKISTILNQIRRAQPSLHALRSSIDVQNRQFHPECWFMFTLLPFSTFLWATILTYAWNYTPSNQERNWHTSWQSWLCKPFHQNDMDECFLLNYEHMSLRLSE